MKLTSTALSWLLLLVAERSHAFSLVSTTLSSKKVPQSQVVSRKSVILAAKPRGSGLNSQPSFVESLPSPDEEDDATPVRVTIEGRDLESFLELAIPYSAPVIAFFTYEYIAQFFSACIDAFSNVSWYPVDGGALQAQVIAPAVNGVVVPSIAVLFATLTSTTVSTLRQRQVDIRKAINIEAADLRNLCQLIQCFPYGKYRDRCRAYLLKYTKRVIEECQPHVSNADDVFDPRRGYETELNDIVLQINKGYDLIPNHLAEQSLGSILRLREQRIQRITALQSTYPLLHYGTLATLALAVVLVFLIETNQDLLFFLNAFQLRILWSILIGTYVACFTVFYDLKSPFAGSYQISASVDQLYSIRRSLAVSIFNADMMTPSQPPKSPSTLQTNGSQPSNSTKVSSMRDENE